MASARSIRSRRRPRSALANHDLTRASCSSPFLIVTIIFLIRTSLAFVNPPNNLVIIAGGPHHRQASTSTTTAVGTATFPTPDGSGLEMEEDFSQDFTCFFPPTRRPLAMLPESVPERGLWLFEQPLHTFPTFEVDIRMTVYALADGTIIAYNPIAPTEETLQEIEDAFGYPDHIIIPTQSLDHTVYIRGWADRFPRAMFWGLEGVNLPGAHFKSTLSTETLPKAWRKELDMCILEGNPLFRECFMFHRSTKTVFAIDSILNLQAEHVPNPFFRTALTMADIYGRPCCPIKPFLRNREKCRATVSKVLEWDFDKIYPAHGAFPIYDGKNTMSEMFQFLWD